jgi:hypothetical protein
VLNKNYRIRLHQYIVGLLLGASALSCHAKVSHLYKYAVGSLLGCSGLAFAASDQPKAMWGESMLAPDKQMVEGFNQVFTSLMGPVRTLLSKGKKDVRLWLCKFLGLTHDQMLYHLNYVMMYHLKRPTFWLCALGIATIGGWIASKGIPMIFKKFQGLKEKMKDGSIPNLRMIQPAKKPPVVPTVNTGNDSSKP